MSNKKKAVCFNEIIVVLFFGIDVNLEKRHWLFFYFHKEKSLFYRYSLYYYLKRITAIQLKKFQLQPLFAGDYNQ